MEKIVASQMIKYMSKHNILYKHQYGFRKGHNTAHPVVHFLNNIYENLNKIDPEYNLSVFIDLKKSFDTGFEENQTNGLRTISEIVHNTL